MNKFYNFFSFSLAYLRSVWWLACFVIYELVALAFHTFFGWNIFIPCPSQFFFSASCWGCGLTGAALALFQGDIFLAWQKNPLIFLVIVVFFSFLVIDIKHFQHHAKN